MHLLSPFNNSSDHPFKIWVVPSHFPHHIIHAVCIQILNHIQTELDIQAINNYINYKNDESALRQQGNVNHLNAGVDPRIH
uniref:Non-structural protein X n=1 Tax=Henipavirus hendraense TaxID=3052223 RepID=O55781_9MONO|nr:non-structural protein X [Henipavirus hendraense]